MAAKNDWKKFVCEASPWVRDMEYSPSKKLLGVSFHLHTDTQNELHRDAKYHEFFDESYMSLPRDERRFDSHGPQPSGSTMHSCTFSDVEKNDIRKILATLTKITVRAQPVLSQADMQNALTALGADKGVNRKRG